jgi:DNA-binding MarR family transcriptional regulator
MPENPQGAYGAGFEPSSASDATKPARLTIALAWIAARQARDRVLGAALFANPAWDILLDLYVNHSRGRRECVSSICTASSSPATTALRWISVLEAQDLVTRAADPSDKRRALVDLTPEGLRKMEAALDAASDSDAKLGLGRLHIVK